MVKKKLPPKKKNPVGAPRTVSPTNKDMISLGKEMIEWIEKHDPLHLSQWYTIHKSFTYKQWKAMILLKEFLPYYEKALKMVGIKYLDGESKKIKDGISQRWQRVYFGDLRENEDQDKENDHQRSLAKIKFEQEQKAAQEMNKGIPINDALLTVLIADLKSFKKDECVSKPKTNS